LANMVQGSLGNSVYSGPFKGMKLPPSSMVGAYAPQLLGIYEKELWPVFERVIATPYDMILNVGCASGYYTTGLALRKPLVRVLAYDINPAEQGRTRDTVTLNGVQDRIVIGGEFFGEDYALCANKKTFLLMDIEGTEMVLLDPVKYPALKQMDILVELHDLFNPRISPTIKERFAATHDIQIIRNQNSLFDFEEITGPVAYIDPFDSLLATWENRDGQTPWAFMTARTYSQSL
ncbi:MAG: hypothetical protein KGJ13_10730, partial [Patescibacteria group bacterium]|nr:hypothetical protein [Patescibacteria group bacterium]